MAAENAIAALSGRNPSNLITEELLGEVQLRGKSEIWNVACTCSKKGGGMSEKSKHVTMWLSAQ